MRAAMQTKLQHHETVMHHSDGWSSSTGDRLYEEVSDAVWMVLEDNEVNVKRRKVNSSDGQKLSTKQTINRI